MEIPPVNLAIQDAYLQAECSAKEILSLTGHSPVQPDVYLWQGDITQLPVDAIVNAVVNTLPGCFVPCHSCIDNAIHSAAGIHLRLESFRIMQAQKTPVQTGKAKIRAFVTCIPQVFIPIKPEKNTGRARVAILISTVIKTLQNPLMMFYGGW